MQYIVEEKMGKEKEKQLCKSLAERARSSSEYALAGRVRRETHQWGIHDPKRDAFVPVAKIVLEEMAVSEPSLKIRLSCLMQAPPPLP